MLVSYTPMSKPYESCSRVMVSQPATFMLIFKICASYIYDGHTATLQMLHFIYFFQQL